MDKFVKLLLSGEDVLMEKVLAYAKDFGYTKYTSTLLEAWRLSIAGLTDAIVKGIGRYSAPPEMGPEDDFRDDPVSRFGVVEAERHRNRGISLSMFLGLMKYYRQSYLDLTAESDLEDKPFYLRFVERVFDRIEIAFCVEWAASTSVGGLESLQERNRTLTNEKNKYLTIFESLFHPVILIDPQWKIMNLNLAASQLLAAGDRPGMHYYYADPDKVADEEVSPASPALVNVIGEPVERFFPWLGDDLRELSGGNRAVEIEKKVEIEGATGYFDVFLTKMLDISGKFSGVVVTLKDITVQIEAQERIQAAERLEAIQRGRMEMASSVLHDVGNALTGIGTTVSKLLGDNSWPEIAYMEKLRNLVEAKKGDFAAALGPGKEDALLSFVCEIRDALEQRRKDYSRDIETCAKIVGHVNEVLHLQRRYAKEGAIEKFSRINPVDAAEDAVAMCMSALEKRGIILTVKYPEEKFCLSGDRTQLVQGLINLIRNSCEAFDELSDERTKRMSVIVERAGNKVIVAVEDNAGGFDPQLTESILERGRTTKAKGSGLGLYQCLMVARAHGGEFNISSRGEGVGAIAGFQLPADEE